MNKDNSSEQLPFQLPLEAARAREDLVVTASNRAAVGLIDSWPDWPGQISILAGPIGAGKTHIAHIWATKSDARFLASHELSDKERIPEAGNYVVENLAETEFDEASLFHLINSVRSSGSFLLMTSRKWPMDWGVELPDLQSRLSAAQLLELHEPDDELLTGVLAKLFSDRQLAVDKTVIDYLVVRMERSLASAQQLVDAIDRHSLVNKKPVTRTLASSVMSELEHSLD